jgi:hypothetical protein
MPIVVVDNGSTDGSERAANRRFPSVKVVCNRYNTGVSGGRNTGIRWINANLNPRYVIFLDNDTQVEPGALKALIEVADQDPHVGMVAPKAFRRRGDRTLLSAGGMQFNPYTGVIRDVAGGELDTGQYDRIREIQACPGFAFLVRTSVFATVGNFDENFNPYGWEDVDLSLRAHAAGFKIVYTPDAIVYHAGGRIGRGINSLYERTKAKTIFYFVRKHTTSWQWMCFLCFLPLRASARIAREILTGNTVVVLMWLDALRRKKRAP